MNLTGQAAFVIRQTRRSRGKLLFSVLAVVLGVAATAAVKTISNSLEEAISRESRSLMGADLRLESSAPLEADESLTVGLKRNGAQAADVVEFFTMIRVVEKGEANGKTRLVRVRAVEGAFPFYGNLTTTPANAFQDIQTGNDRAILVDPTLFPALGVSEGARVALGKKEYRIEGVINNEPGSPGFSAGFGPPVYVSLSTLEKTNLLVTGSRIKYMRYFKIPQSLNVEDWKQAHWKESQEANITIFTFREAVSSVRRFMTNLSRFLTLAGLVILFLGGLGIGLAMNVFVKSRLDDIATARALGATPGFMIRIYIALGSALAIIGSAVGVVMGYLAAKAAGDLGGGYLPVQIEVAFDPAASLAAVVPGIVVTLAFVLFPVFRTRKISPLRVLRRMSDDEAAETGPLLSRIKGFVVSNGVEILAALVMVGVMLAVSITQSDSGPTGIFFTAGVLGAALLLLGISRLLIRAVKKLLPFVKSYRLRQGLANLYRPGNQTSTMLVATGVGVLLIMTIFTAEAAVRGEISFTSRGRPNLFLVDIQEEQKDGVLSLMQRYAKDSKVTPMITMRLRAINGVLIDKSDIEKDANQRSWQNSIRSYEYRSTFRTKLNPGEVLTAGNFWEGRDPQGQEVSVDERWASEFNVSIGDQLTLDIQGLPLDAIVTSKRRVDWAAMQINSILVFSPGPIQEAPRVYYGSINIADEKDRFSFQESLVARFPNITVIDANQALETISGIAKNIAFVVQWMAGATLAAGMIILTGCIGSSRYARLRESVLLKTIGARSVDIVTILTVEYAVLGLLGAFAGTLLSQALAWPLLYYFFEVKPGLPLVPALLVGGAVVGLTIAIGLLVSRDAMAGKPLDVLREETT
ncbi:MAG: FtsX-like permease family protein [Leptospirales bacterium]|nr:FtsX-like permease family protein [Leptospirales bacterium]